MRLLLDTCAISELRKPKPDKQVRALIEETPDEDLFVSALTIGEITKGIQRLSDSPKKRELVSWLNALEHHYANERILPVDTETARMWGSLTASAQASGRTIPAIDGLIAATALQHGLRILTRNEADFASTGVMIVNPWSS